MSLKDAVCRFTNLFPQREPERWMLHIAEEAGEVVGAFNKWHYAHKTKVRTRDDVLEELAQLHGVVLCVADELGVPHDEFLKMTEDFLISKREQILAVRAGQKA